VIEAIMPYVDLGFEDLVLHAPGHDQRRFLDQFSADVLPALRDEAEKRAAG
jgi:coenzyme F420-dependent glucose-6-phosphate dehydrogenase